MIGQYSDLEFRELLKDHSHDVDYLTMTAWISYGKYTTNYYRQESDGSWTNYHCKTF